MTDKSIIYQAVSIFDRYYNQAAMKFVEFKTQVKAKSQLNPEDGTNFASVSEISNLNQINSFEDFMNINIKLLSPENLLALTRDAEQEVLIAGMTALLQASKNQEVEPLSLSDVCDFFLHKHFHLVVPKSRLLDKEIEMRRAIEYQTEVTTLFDYVMYFIKIWKINCQDRLQEQGQPFYEDMYDFFGSIEALAYDFSKSLLIDAHCLSYKASISICALISVSIELYLRIKMSSLMYQKGQTYVLHVQ